MLKLCSYSGCKTTVEVDIFDRNPPRCCEHPFSFTPKKRYEHHYHQGKHIYSSSRWKRLRAAKIAQNPLCEMCLKDGLVTPVKDVDHIVEVKDNGEIWDINNLMSLCRHHHIGKTIEQRKKRGKKFDSISDF